MTTTALHLRRPTSALALLFFLAAPLAAQPVAQVAPPALEAIQEVELREDLFRFASDEMRGRAAGTLDELRAAAWLAEQARAAGLEPAGDDGTFFQFFHVQRTEPSAASRVSINGAELTLGRDVLLPFPSAARVEASLVRYVPGTSTTGRIVVVQPPPPVRLEGMREDMAAVAHFFNALVQDLPAIIGGGALGIIAVPDAVTAEHFDTLVHFFGRGSFGLEGAESMVMELPLPILIAHPDALPEGDFGGTDALIDISILTYDYPSLNVVARAPGGDARLAHEHVLFSAHHDHDGVSEVDGEKAVWNGADDNGTGSVALLAIGRAFTQNPGRRSALFVWHGAEERGLLGSKLYVTQPTIPRENIVAVLNADMIGRNHPDTTALLGARAGNRNSTDLANAALLANESVTEFVIDQSWDAPDHPENFWQRSDHFPYAASGVPAIFFTTALHPDYHTPNDTADLIDYAKLTRMAQWIYTTGWIIANADERPALDGGL